MRTLRNWRRQGAEKKEAARTASSTAPATEPISPSTPASPSLREKGRPEDDAANPFGAEHAWWAERDRLQRVFVASGADEGQTHESPLSEYWSPESLFNWGRRPGEDDVAWEDEAPQIDPYEVLGLPLYATWDQVTAAHRRLAKQHHPDRLLDASEEDRAASEERMRQINQAYNELRRQRKASETAGTQDSASTYFSSY